MAVAFAAAASGLRPAPSWHAASPWRSPGPRLAGFGESSTPLAAALPMAALAVAATARTRRRAKGFGAPAKKKKAGARGPAKASDSDLRALDMAVKAAVERHLPAMIEGLRTKGWWDSEEPVLAGSLHKGMRKEVEALWRADMFKLSQSTRGAEYYDKKHVYATEIDGGKYDLAPRMCTYTVATTRALAEGISKAFPEAQLSSQFIGNKLNFSSGEGATFDAHRDMGVGEKPFNRKLTLLIYLNPSWRADLGGEIVLCGEGATEEETQLDTGTAAAGLPRTVPPTSGRWVVFWSDKMLHKVLPSFAPGGLPDYRCSYTIWFCTEDAPEAPAASPGYESAPDFASF